MQFVLDFAFHDRGTSIARCSTLYYSENTTQLHKLTDKEISERLNVYFTVGDLRRVYDLQRMQYAALLSLLTIVDLYVVISMYIHIPYLLVVTFFF